MDNVSFKAYNTLKFIKLNVKTINKKIKETAYNTYVIPQLEYCSSIWHPWQKTQTYKIERVQRAAARYVLNNYDFTSSVTEMIQSLNWQTLHQRRINTSLILFYKISNNLVAVDHHYLIPIKKKNCLCLFLKPYIIKTPSSPEQLGNGIVSQIILGPVPS